MKNKLEVSVRYAGKNPNLDARLDAVAAVPAHNTHFDGQRTLRTYRYESEHLATVAAEHFGRVASVVVCPR